MTDDDVATSAPPGRAGPVHLLLDRYHRVTPVLDRITIGAAVTLVTTGVLVTALSVAARKLPLLPSMSWASELTTFCLVAAVLLVLPQGLRQNTQMAVTVLTDRLGDRGFQRLTAVNQVLSAVLFAVLAWFGTEMVLLQQAGHSPQLGLSMAVPYLVLVVSAVLMLFETVVRFTEALLGRAPRGPVATDDPVEV
ncbi:TRAP transporter small permease [Pseudonocardia sp. ICBG1293]|uniref:TRAP transporter small permease n=1 Tax=Pseudonocardia sp. ICBG1293 TaxID=2844382 RepID=UPI001CC972A9|nr:TRAP transporter small permease [Pseudonocardia sp. ICBG1293]